MKQKISFIQLGLVSVALFAISLIFGAADTFAAERVWTGDGSDNNLATAANWQGGVAPVDGDSLVFNDPSTLEVNNNLTSSVTIDGVTVIGVSSTAQVTIQGSDLSIEGAISGENGRVIFANNATLASSVIVDPLDNNFGVEFEGVLGGGSLTVSSGASAVLSGNNSNYAGAITVNGSLWVQHANALGSTSAGTTVAGGGYLLFQMSSGSMAVAEPLTLSAPNLAQPVISACTPGVMSCMRAEGSALTLSGSISLGSNVSFRADNDIVVSQSPSGGGYSISAHHLSTGSVSVAGQAVSQSEALVVTVTSQDQCPEQIWQNEVYIINIDCSNVTNLNGLLYIAQGGVLRGIGKVPAISVYGTIAPGNSPGTIDTGDLTFGESGVYEFEVAGAGSGQYDRINVTGTVTLGNGTLRVVPLNNFQPRAGQSFIIISNDGSDAVNGTFAGLPEGATVSVGGTAMFTISYRGGDGNDVVLTALPSGSDTGAKQDTSHNNLFMVVGAAFAVSLVVVRKFKLARKG